jgi:hypothetical protein
VRLFCLCKAAWVVKRADGALRLSEDKQEFESGIALTEFPMEVIRQGLEQYIVGLESGNALKPSEVKNKDIQWIRQHHPNVDLRRCRYCGIVIAVQ